MKTQKLQQINDYFLSLRKRSSFFDDLCVFFDSKNIEFGFLGGAVRNAIANPDSIPRDLDIIFNENDEIFDSFLGVLNINYKKNSFGGRKIEVDSLKFDIWSLSKHHLIREKIYKQDFKNVPKTTFLDYDSIFYNYTKHTLIDNYSNCIFKNTIGVVGNKKSRSSNSRMDVTICKLALLHEQGFMLSDELNSCISDYLHNFFEVMPLFESEDLMDCFLYNYKKHIESSVSIEAVRSIVSFVDNYL